MSTRQIQPKRARKDYPKGVRRITDNGGRTADRYTVLYEPIEGWYQVQTMSADPYYAQGVCISGEYPQPIIRRWYDRIITFTELPTDCQQVVNAWLQEDN